MAGFDDSKDIKINVTLDTEDAVNASKDLKGAIEGSLKATGDQFQKVETAVKDLSSKIVKEAKGAGQEQVAVLNKTVAATVAASDKIAKITADAVAKNVREELKGQALILASRKAATREAEIAGRQLAEKEKTQRTQLLKDIAELNLKRTIVKKTPRAELPSELGGISGSGKALKALEGVAVSLGNRFGYLTLNATAAFRILSSFGPLGATFAVVTAAVGVFGYAVNKLNEPIDKLAKQAGNLEGLKIGFETLQRSIGEDPTASINKLREATQGLISDTDLYQRANQAVLLGVPTKTFNQAAAAAVKLGRAMGIDAAFGLESLSLGLGRQSRLYLDNLGIIVSAEQAYLRFAQANNIVGRSLTDSEKKAAFYEEALSKIKERADELPDILDSVGIALKKVEVAQSNVNAKFLEGFNRSSELAAAYKEQAKIIQEGANTFERLGERIGAVGAKLKALQNILISLGILSLDTIADAIDGLFGETKQQQFNKTTRAVALLEKNIKETTKALEGSSRGDPAFSQLRASLLSSKIQLVAANLAVKELGVELGILQVQGTNGINIKVDLTDLNAAKLRFAGFVDELQAEVLAAGNEFEIPGLSKESISKALKSYEKLIKGRELGSIGSDDAKKKLSEIVDPLALELQASKLKDINTQIALLATKQVQLAGSTSEVANELFNQLKVLEAQRTAAQGVAGITEDVLEKLKKGFKNSSAAGVKGAGDVRKAFEEQRKGVLKLEKEYESLSKALRRALGNAIPKNFQKELVNLFNGGATSGEEFEKALDEIGKRAKAAGVDMAAFLKEVVDLKKLADQGVKIRVDAETSEADAEIQKTLKGAQAGMLNLRELFFGKDPSGQAQGGAFFGFSLKEFFSDATSSEELQNAEAAIADAVAGGLKLAIDLAFTEGLTSEDAAAIGEQVGAAIGAAIGASMGGAPGAAIGAQIGGTFGQIVGEIIKRNFGDSPGARQKKQIDKYFSALFHKERLVVVIADNLRAAFSEAELLARDFAGVITLEDGIARVSNPNQRKKGRPQSEIDDMFNLLSSESQAALQGVALAFGQIVGVGVEASRNIAYAFANNIGGSLQNLQVLIQGTGESFDNLSAGIVEAFLDAQLTIDEAYNALVQLQNLYQVGLPDALGDYEQAARNLFDILADNRPGRYAIDSLRDIGAEGIEAKKTFDAVISSLGGTFAFTAEQQTRLFEALRINGITSLAQLQTASDAQLLAILLNIQRIREDATAPLATTPQTEFESKPAPSSGGDRKKSPAQEALEKLREETKRLVRESLEYESILKKITSGELTRAAAGAAIIKLQTEIQNALKKRTRLEEALEAELDKGRKANKKRLADLAARLDAVNKKIDEFTDKTEGTTRVFKELDLKGVIPFIKDANNLGVVMKQVGVTFETASDILVKGFLQGRLTLGELRAEMDKTEQTLGAGIPNSIGAVTDAFQNLIDAGTQGGTFSVDAFTDVFAEFREKFEKEGSALREAERVQLNANLALANSAFKNAVGPEATAAARKVLDEAKKALDDFNASVSAPDLADLRSQLTATFGAGEVDKFFRALDESGLKTFEDFEKAGSGSIVGILTKLEELGFSFGQTSQDIIDAQKALRDAEKEANSGFDPLQEAINLVKGLNEGAGQLPPVFNATTQAIEGMNGPLTALADGFDDIIEKLAKLSGQKFENDVVFNIRTTGSEGGQALVELLFGDGEGAIGTIPPPASGGTPPGGNADKIARFRAEMKELRRKGLKDPRRKARFDLLRNRIAQLGG